MTACSVCGSSARLRFDREASAWVCVVGCGLSTTVDNRRSGKRAYRRPSLFVGKVVDNGVRRRATRDELREAYRLWQTHADVRGAA